MMFSILATCMALLYYVNVPVTDLREKPENTSEIVSQIYYSEKVKVIDYAQNWLKIKNLTDDYVGWVNKEHILGKENEYIFSTSDWIKVNRKKAHVYHVKDTIYGPVLTLPFEARLKVIEQSDPRWIKILLIDDTLAYIQKGDVSFETSFLTMRQMCSFSKKFLDIPYYWGGRSSFGYDCSGFVQMLYRQMGYFIPRDSKDQINWEGFIAIPKKKIKKGDVIFFTRDGMENPFHVGLYLGYGKFIHADVNENKPYIRISHINDSFWNTGIRQDFRQLRKK